MKTDQSAGGKPHRVSLKNWGSDTEAEAQLTAGATLTSDAADFGDDITDTIVVPRSRTRSFCSRRGPHIAVALVVVAALAGVVAVMFLRSQSSNSIPIPEKFSATVVAYEKLPNGTTYGSPLLTADAHRDGSTLRAVAELLSGDNAQRHRFVCMDDKAAYQVYESDSLLDEEDALPEDRDGDEVPTSVSCVAPGDTPSVDDMHAALKQAYEIDEAVMLDTVGPGGCEGDVTRFLGEYEGTPVVVCLIDSFKFQVVSTDFVAYIDGTTQVDTAALEAIEMPTALDGQPLSCPTLSGVVARAADKFALARRRLSTVQDCIQNAANNPLLGNCASVTSSLSSCGVAAYGLYWYTGLFYWSCVPHDCSNTELSWRSSGNNVLCLPMATSRRLGKKDDPNSFMTRLTVPKSMRVKECTKKHRTPVKRCVFMHGAGAPSVSNALGSALTSKFPWYWGPMHHHVNQYCTDVKFLRLPTADNPWDAPVLGRHFCHWVAGRGQQDINSASFGDIDDTLLFVHGSGNLIAAKAFKDGLCSMAASSHWFEIQDGEHLSRMAKWNREFCAEVAAQPNGAELDAHLEVANAKLEELKGGKKWKDEKSRKEWRDWRRQWRKTFDPDTWKQLSKRQRQRRLVRRLGVCKKVDTPTAGFPLSSYTFEQNDAWLSLHQSNEAGAFPSRASGDELKALASIINTGVSGSMCSSLSDNARHRAIFHDVKPTIWTNEFEPYETRWSRCWSKSQHEVFKPNPRYHSYSAITSFYEATCRYGNPPGEAKDGINRPCDWFRHMTCSYGTVDTKTGSITAPPTVSITDDDFLTDAQAAAEDEDAATGPEY